MPPKLRSTEVGDANLFRQQFQLLTGKMPMSWQERLYRDHFARNDLCSVIDLPTGLGKTTVMAIWLIARASNCGVPTRLIYVVDRRTVVDQASDLAKMLVENWKKHAVFDGEPPAISTLRGQLADNREWSRDPARPAIIIGTVDLIGSALLFSGYRSSYKRRPLEAGLLGQDSLLVLDEAHLSRPFEKLIRAINQDGEFQKDREGNPHGSPVRVIRMSATSEQSAAGDRVFTLQFDKEGNLGGEDAVDATISERFNAAKRLDIVPIDEKDDLNKRLAEAAIKLARNPEVVGKRIAIFVRKPDDAREVAHAIRTHVVESVDESGSKPKKIKNTPYEESVEILTGTMRGLERDKLVEKPVFLQRWLEGGLKPDSLSNESPVFLVSTSAGEVGFDLNADHMVSDATTIDSLIQRLGRVNRRGLGNATVILLREPVKMRDGKEVELTGIDLAIQKTLRLIEHVKDVSPRNIAALKTNDWKDKYSPACSPEPATVDLTDILLDGWSMTSINGPMPGRPDVGPWLRGIDDERAQTTIAWRAELELYGDDSTPEKKLQAIFAAHPIRPHESLTVNTGQLLEFLKRISKLRDRPPNLIKTRAAVRMPRGQVIVKTLEDLIDEPGILYADSTFILPARFGGLDKKFGVLDVESIPEARKDEDVELPSLDEADHPGYEQREDAPPRLRVVIERTDEGNWKPQSLPGGVAISDRLELEGAYATSTSLFADLRWNGLRIRRVQTIKFDDEGDADRSLVLLSPVSNRGKSDDQSLDEHVGAVEKEAKQIADRLKLAKDDPVSIALLFAARWHDEGKKAEIWQRFVYGQEGNGYKGKSSKTRDPGSLRGYRHEFGSLLRIAYPERCGTTGCMLPTDPDARELALHLIATHHGMARPHFSMAIYHGFGDAERDAIHTEAVRRFARLQRKYGHWHLAWLENLLRCADAAASADHDAEDDPVDAEAIGQ